MNWDDLRIFLLVVRRGSLVAAAHELALDHSTVSRRITGLEKHLGARLFDRAGRRLRITAAGERLRGAAERLEAIMLREVAAIADDGEGIGGRVRIGAPEGLGAGYLGRIIGLFSARYAELEIELVALPQNYSLASREVDIAITLDRPRTGNVSTRKLTDYDLCPYASRALLAGLGEGLPLATIRELPSCGYIPGMLFTRELAYLDLPAPLAPPRLRSTSILVQRDIIEAGHAVGILPRYLAQGRGDLIPLHASSMTITRSYWISIHADLRELKRMRVMLDEMGRQVRQDQPLFRP